MISVSTPTLNVTFPDRINPMKALTESEAETLNQILTARAIYYARTWLAKNIPPEEVQVQLNHFVLTHSFDDRIDEGFDPLTLEARRIARTLIVSRLAASNISVTEETLETHIAAASKLPSVLARAQEILDAQKAAARSALGKGS